MHGQPVIRRAERADLMIENVWRIRTSAAAAWAAGRYKAVLLTGSKREATQRFHEGAGFRRDFKAGFRANRSAGL